MFGECSGLEVKCQTPDGEVLGSNLAVTELSSLARHINFP